MKRFIIYILSLLTALSCQRFDYESVLEQLRDHEELLVVTQLLKNRLVVESLAGEGSEE